MVAHSQSIFSNHVSLTRVADHWVRKTRYMLSKGLEFRKANPDHRFTDVFYEELVGAPMKTLAEIYRPLGGISPEVQQRFTETEKKNIQNKYGTHAYRLEDFGLTKQQVNEKMKFYSDFLNEAVLK
jgi:hypothetical protein